MYEHVGEVDQAASAYHQVKSGFAPCLNFWKLKVNIWLQYIVDTEDQGIADRDQQSRAYKYLAQYFVKQAKWDDAYTYAQKW